MRPLWVDQRTQKFPSGWRSQPFGGIHRLRWAYLELMLASRAVFAEFLDANFGDLALWGNGKL